MERRPAATNLVGMKQISIGVDITNGHIASNSVEFHFSTGTLLGFEIVADDRGSGYAGEVCIFRCKPNYVDFEGFNMNNRWMLMNVMPDAGVVRLRITVKGDASCTFTPFDPSTDDQGNTTVEEHFPSGFDGYRGFNYSDI